MTTPLQIQTLPVLPLRDIVVFPNMIVPLFVGREKSVRALESAMLADRTIMLATQKNSQNDDPSKDDLFKVGVIATVIQLLKLPDGTVKALVEGQGRAQTLVYTDNADFFEAMVDTLPDKEDNAKTLEEITALTRGIINQFENYIKLNKKLPAELMANINQIEEPVRLIDTIVAHLTMKIPQKQELLEMTSLAARLDKVYQILESEIGVLQVEKKIRGRVKKQIEKNQREYYLNEQLKAIHKELGEKDENEELAELEAKLKKTKLSKEARTKADGELKKLKSMPPMSAESTVVRNYLDWLVSLPWNKPGKLIKDIKFAEDILNEDHFGLEKVKERILEYLAVQQRVGHMKGSILCLVGPPGVGKTSLGRSIAKATGREYVRLSLGGMRDESEIRGHRRTYIGSMPGKLIQNMKKAGQSNPLFLLDEIDKLGADWRGDPSSALLEVLDPEQNKTFNDHYMEVDYDLSGVMFICTANSLNMPRPLLDRMEIIRIAGYTEEEKLGISKKHLLPKQMKENGVNAEEFSITDEAITALIQRYTREAGVRSLEREFANLCRKATKEIVTGKADKVEITPSNLNKYAGIPRHKHDELEDEDRVGVVTGLAWTEVGGELLQVEAVTLHGKGRVTMTGKLGDVMKESVQAAEMFIKSRSPTLGIHPSIYNERDVHVHVPEGATPKDGPSAGVAMVTAIVSVLTDIPIKRDVAMTGEITLRGRVLAIGGLKEKLLAALRGGIKTVLIPQDNEKDLEDIPDTVKNNLTIIPVRVIDEVLHHALTKVPLPIDAKDVKPYRHDASLEKDFAAKNESSDFDKVVRH